jgi:hypothetical protein
LRNHFSEEEIPMMTLLDSLRFRRFCISTRSARPPRNRRRASRKALLDFQPRWGWDLIVLEHRSLLSAVNWVGGSGDWDTKSNWSTGQVPGASDDVTINVSPGITVTHQMTNNDQVDSLNVASADTLSISSGTLSIGSGMASAINGPLNLTGGTLEGTGTVTVSGAMTQAVGVSPGFWFFQSMLAPAR